mgnify:CR=1 FL=1
MERFILKKLLDWKNSPYRKPLILKGVRQVGKTWILKEFGKCYYENTAYFNFDENEEYKSHPEEFEEQREEYEMEPGDTFDFEDELQYWLDDWKLSKLSMAEEVEAIRDYVEALRKFKGE